jgi:hypothetical protein
VSCHLGPVDSESELQVLKGRSSQVKDRAPELRRSRSQSPGGVGHEATAGPGQCQRLLVAGAAEPPARAFICPLADRARHRGVTNYTGAVPRESEVTLAFCGSGKSQLTLASALSEQRGLWRLGCLAFRLRLHSPTARA